MNKENIVSRLKEAIKLTKYDYERRSLFLLLVLVDFFDDVTGVKENETRTGWNYEEDFINSASNPNLNIYAKKDNYTLTLTFSVQLFTNKDKRIVLRNTPLKHAMAALSMKNSFDEKEIFEVKQELKTAFQKEVEAIEVFKAKKAIKTNQSEKEKDMILNSLENF